MTDNKILTMPYLLQNSQNRVENIKKKFENPYFDTQESGNIQKDCKSFISHYKARGVKVFKSANLERENENREKFRLQNDKNSNKSDVSRGEGKAIVRRSPAFRREKQNYGKNAKSLTDVSAQLLHKQALISGSNVEFHKNSSCDDGGVLKLKNGILRNNTEPNLLHLPESTKTNSGDNLACDLFVKPVEVITKEKDKNHKNIINDNILVQYSQNNSNNNNNNNNSSNSSSSNSNSNSNSKSDSNPVEKPVTGSSKNGLKITDSIRLALKAPLPKGPPPKKPPRTFVHTINATDTALSNQNSETVLKKDDPILRLKLKKIETVIKSLDHKTNMPCESIKTESGRPPTKVKLCETTTLPQAVHGQSSDAFTFKSLKCFSSEGYEKPFVCEKEIEKQSSFYVDCPKDEKDCNKTDIKTHHINGKPTLPLVKRRGSEHIYDLPCVNKKNSFESFGKGTREGETISSNPQHLHYMCTDVVNSIQDAKSSTFLMLNHGDCMSGSFHSEKINDKVKQKVNKHQAIQKKCPEFSFTDVKKEKSELSEAKDELRMIMNDAFSALNHNLRKMKCNSPGVDIDSDPDSGLEDSNSNFADNSEIAHSGHNRKKQDDVFVPPMNNKKDNLTRQTTASRKTYVKRVSCKILNHSPFTKGLTSESYSHLFESCILVGLTLAESKATVPYIKSIFPSNVKPPPLIEYLCFPDASTWSQSNCNLQQGEQYYSLVITNENGYRKFGYCRRVLPEGGNFCLPLVYCITSPHRANGFYYKVLQELESRHGSSELQAFIKQLYECNFPGPGQSLKFKKILEEVTKVSPIKMNECLSSTLVRRPCDVRREERDLSQLLQHLKVSVLLKVFSSLLLERKVLLLGHSLRNLSSCIEALQSLLIPFSWQHTFIPVLPNTLNEMCDAPTPYIIGLQKSTFSDEFLSNLNFEDGIMIDLEESHIIKCCGDEGSIIPERLIKGLKTALNLALSASLESDSDRNVLISEAFIRFFVQICGNYSYFIVKQPSGKKIFQKEDFINSMPAIQAFLDWFVETAMFRSFIEERLQNDIEDLFKKRAIEHLDEADKNAALFSKNYKGVNRKVKSIGDRIKDLTLFSK